MQRKQFMWRANKRMRMIVNRRISNLSLLSYPTRYECLSAAIGISFAVKEQAVALLRNRTSDQDAIEFLTKRRGK